MPEASPFMVPWMRRFESQQDKEAVEQRGSDPFQEIVDRDSASNALWEGREPFSAYDPRLPPHPIFNQPPVREEPTWQLLAREAKQRAKCLKEYDEALSLIKAGRFHSRREIASHFGKRADWACEMVKLMVELHDLADVKRLLPGKRRRTKF